MSYDKKVVYKLVCWDKGKSDEEFYIEAKNKTQAKEVFHLLFPKSYFIKSCEKIKIY